MKLASQLALFASVAAFALLPAAGAQVSPEPRPASRWVIETGGPTCVVSGELPGNPPAALVVQTYAGSNEYDVVLSRSWPPALRQAQQVKLSFRPGGTSFERPGQMALIRLPGAPDDLRFLALTGDLMRVFGGASTLEISADRKSIATFRLPGAADVARVFAECERNKLLAWGADPAGFAPGARRPRPIGDSPRWVNPSDIKRLTNGTFEMRVINLLHLNSSGRPEKCAVLESNLSQQGNAAACRVLMEKAKYEPARDAQGNAIRSVVSHRAWVVTHVGSERL